MLKSIGVVLGSYMLSIVLVLATDPLLSRLFPADYVRGQTSSGTALATSTAFFVAISILCAWLCARFAPGRAARHVLWFFVIGEVLGVGTTILNWNKGMPHWYFLSWLLTWPISCWIGLLAGRRRSEASFA
jgi:Ca2+/Na+ antiporter